MGAGVALRDCVPRFGATRVMPWTSLCPAVVERNAGERSPRRQPRHFSAGCNRPEIRPAIQQIRRSRGCDCRACGICFFGVGGGRPRMGANSGQGRSLLRWIVYEAASVTFRESAPGRVDTMESMVHERHEGHEGEYTNRTKETRAGGATDSVLNPGASPDKKSRAGSQNSGGTTEDRRGGGKRRRSFDTPPEAGKAQDDSVCGERTVVGVGGGQAMTGDGRAAGRVGWCCCRQEAGPGCSGG